MIGIDKQVLPSSLLAIKSRFIPVATQNILTEIKTLTSAYYKQEE